MPALQASDICFLSPRPYGLGYEILAFQAIYLCKRFFS